jgi:hypothetical protein
VYTLINICQQFHTFQIASFAAAGLLPALPSPCSAFTRFDSLFMQEKRFEELGVSGSNPFLQLFFRGIETVIKNW